jgi:hypothetical protein
MPPPQDQPPQNINFKEKWARRPNTSEAPGEFFGEHGFGWTGFWIAEAGWGKTELDGEFGRCARAIRMMMMMQAEEPEVQVQGSGELDVAPQNEEG